MVRDNTEAEDVEPQAQSVPADLNVIIVGLVMLLVSAGLSLVAIFLGTPRLFEALSVAFLGFLFACMTTGLLFSLTPKRWFSSPSGDGVCLLALGAGATFLGYLYQTTFAEMLPREPIGFLFLFLLVLAAGLLIGALAWLSCAIDAWIYFWRVATTSDETNHLVDGRK